MHSQFDNFRLPGITNLLSCSAIQVDQTITTTEGECTIYISGDRNPGKDCDPSIGWVDGLMHTALQIPNDDFVTR
jgi:hypothetical protein